MALSILLFTLLDKVASDLASQVLGFDSIDALVATIIVVNFAFLIVVVVYTVYQTLSNPGVQLLRLVSSREVPELSLNVDLDYHLFLSHIWSSGQACYDQAANIKRKLQLLTPGVKVFLCAADVRVPCACGTYQMVHSETMFICARCFLITGTSTTSRTSVNSKPTCWRRKQSFCSCPTAVTQ
eukprot:190475-Prymnesium_polylepis.1